MRTVNWVIPDYHCHHCLRKITEALRDIKGVRLLRGDPAKHLLTVEGNNPEVLAYAKCCLAEAGYPVQASPFSG
jgi:copper chaperone CopZ